MGALTELKYIGSESTLKRQIKISENKLLAMCEVSLTNAVLFSSAEYEIFTTLHYTYQLQESI